MNDREQFRVQFTKEIINKRYMHKQTITMNEYCQYVSVNFKFSCMRKVEFISNVFDNKERDKPSESLCIKMSKNGNVLS